MVIGAANPGPYRLAARDSHPDDTVLTLGGVCVGGERIVVMAGPCAIESYDHLKAAARAGHGLGTRRRRL
jgi:3-deoxy-7-phosphoheptulonate synthase